MGDYHQFPALPRTSGRTRPCPRSLSSRSMSRSYTAPTPLSLYGDTRSVLTAGATEPDFFEPLEMPDVTDLISRGIPTRRELADMLTRTGYDDIQRFPAIHPYVASARGETLIQYMSFVSRPPVESKAPRHRPRTMAVIPRLWGPESCFKCQLRTEHSKCEKHTYLRIGGGFRHSFWYIRKVLDAIEQKQRVGLEETKQKLLRVREREAAAAMLRAEALARAQADILAAKAKKVKKRRIKTYVRTVTGEVVSQYHFLSERDYKDIKKNKKKAKQLLGLKEDEKLEDWSSSKHVYEETTTGDLTKVKRQKQKEKIRIHKPLRDIQSVESGIGQSIRDGDVSRVSKYTPHSNKHVRWDNITDHSDNKPEIEVTHKENTHRKKKKSSKKKEERRMKENVTDEPDKELRPWSPSNNDSESESSDNDSVFLSSDKKHHKKMSSRMRRIEKRRRRMRRHREADGEYNNVEEELSNRRRSKRRDHKTAERPPRDGSWSPIFGSDFERARTDRKKKKKKEKKRRRRRRSTDTESDESSVAPRRHRQKTKRKEEKKAAGLGGNESSSSEESSSYESEDSETGSENSSYNSSYDSSGSSSTDSEFSSESSSSESSSTSSSSSESSSEMSDVSSSYVSTSDLSAIDSEVSEGERKIRIAEKKKQKVLLLRVEKTEKKVEKRQKEKELRKVQKEAKKEVKKETKNVRKEQLKQEKNKRKEWKRQERVQRYEKRRDNISVTECSDSTVDSQDVSDVDASLAGEDRSAAKEAKKAHVRRQRKEVKVIAKQEVKLKQQKAEQKREHQNKKMKKAIAKELSRVSSASSASSVHSSDLSDVDGLEGIQNEEDKQKMRDEKKSTKKAEKKVQKLFQKAVVKVLIKRRKHKSSAQAMSDYSDEIYDTGFNPTTRRKKKEFKHLLPKDDLKTMVKMAKGSKRGLSDMIKKTDGRGMEWFDEWQKKRDEEKLEKERLAREAAGSSDDEYNLLKSSGQMDKSVKMKLKAISRRKKTSIDNSDIGGTKMSENAENEESLPRINQLSGDGDLADDLLQTSVANEVWDGFGSPPSTPSEIGKIRGVRKVNTAFKEQADVMQSHLKTVLDTASELHKDEHVRARDDPPSNNSKITEVKHTEIDYLSHYRLIDAPKIEPFGRAFVVMDEDQDCTLDYEELRDALDGVQSLSEIKHKQIEYVLKVLEIDVNTKITFKKFAVIAAVCERMCSMDPFGKYLIDSSDLMDLDRKMMLYKSMFYCNVNSELSKNHITAESLRIELLAGGLSRNQERYVMSRMKTNAHSEISFFDYMVYIPLFLSMHDNIIDNPLDMAEKYNVDSWNQQNISVRDLNPLGLPLRPEFLDAHTSIYPSGIPSGRPVIKTPVIVAPEPEVDDATESVTSDVSDRLPSLSSKPSSGRTSRSLYSARSSLTDVTLPNNL